MEVKGTKELLQKLNSINSAVSGKIIKNAVAKGCHKVQAAAKLLCPKDTGELIKSIVTKVEKKGDRITGKVYTNKEYAPYVEFGTGPKGQEDHDGISPNITPSYREKGWSYKDEETGERVYTRGQPAQPYMYPALKDNEEEVKNQIAEDVVKEIRKLVE